MASSVLMCLLAVPTYLEVSYNEDGEPSLTVPFQLVQVDTTPDLSTTRGSKGSKLPPTGGKLVNQGWQTVMQDIMLLVWPKAVKDGRMMYLLKSYMIMLQEPGRTVIKALTEIVAGMVITYPDKHGWKKIPNKAQVGSTCSGYKYQF